MRRRLNPQLHIVGLILNVESSEFSVKFPLPYPGPEFDCGSLKQLMSRLLSLVAALQDLRLNCAFASPEPFNRHCNAGD